MQVILNAFHDLLIRIHEIIFPIRESEEAVRYIKIDDLRTHIALQEREYEGCAVTSLLPYRLPIVQSCMLEAKFHHNSHAYDLLGALLAEFLLEKISAANSSGGIIMVPVPLGTKRRKERGYNQVEEIAKAAAAKLNDSEFILAPRLLTRERNTAPQMELGREERLTNVRGAFASTVPRLPDRLMYVLLDDVFTTGATLTSAAAALRAAGAIRIFCLSIAH